MTTLKSHEKKLFSYDDVVKCRQNLNFEKIDTEKLMGFDEEYLRSNSSEILLRQC